MTARSYKYEIRCRRRVSPAPQGGSGGVRRRASAAPPGRSSATWRRATDWNDQAWMKHRAAELNRDRCTDVDLRGPPGQLAAACGRRRQPATFLSGNMAAQLVRPTSLDLGFTHLETDCRSPRISLRRLLGLPADRTVTRRPFGFGTPDEFRTLRGRHVTMQGVGRDHRLGTRPLSRRRSARALSVLTERRYTSMPTGGRDSIQDWNTLVYNYGRREVQQLSHCQCAVLAEGISMSTACASMRLPRCCIATIRGPKEGEWVPNIHGGRENLEAIAFLQAHERRSIYGAEVPGILSAAEESTAFPGVTHTGGRHGGLGFGFKWNMGWMNDTLSYMCPEDPMQPANIITHKMTFRPALRLFRELHPSA